MNTTASKLFSPLILPNGQTIPNRLCKAAMEENLSDEGQLPGDRLFRLYSRWAEGGAGLVELSGGSYESPAMQGRTTEKEGEKPESTLRREAYFVDFARDIASVARMPVMVTGGILRRAVAEAALEKDSQGFGVDMLGIARAMAFQPDLPNRWKDDELEIKLPQVNWKNRTFAALAVMAVTKVQLNRLAQGKTPKANVSPLFSLIGDQIKTKKRTKRYRRWRESTADA